MSRVGAVAPSNTVDVALRRNTRARPFAFALLVSMLAGCAVSAPSLRPRPLSQAPSQPVARATPAGEWPKREVLELALQAFRCGAREGRFRRPVLTVIDYSLPSSDPRLWVIDLRRQRVLYRELVAHGERSGDKMAVAFSNEIDSRQSSLGLFRTDETYTGRNGYSLRLSGLEPGVNDHARERAIVVHGAPYVSYDVIRQYGRIGTTWGCPGLPEDLAPKVIDAIANGSAVFSYYPDKSWLRSSRYLHCGARADATAALAVEEEMLLAANALSTPSL